MSQNTCSGQVKSNFRMADYPEGYPATPLRWGRYRQFPPLL